MALAAVTDLRSRIIPNAAVLWVLAAGLGARLLAGGPAIWVSLAFLPILFLPLAILAYRGDIGGGDAKLIPVASLLVRPGLVLELLLAITLSGGLVALVMLILQRTGPGRWGRKTGGARPAPGASVSNAQTGIHLTAPTADLPYGVAILLGTVVTLLGHA